MQWRKLGIVWRPDGTNPLARTHATCPTPYIRKDGTLRVYFSSRDKNGIGRTFYVDLDRTDPTRVLKVMEKPVLDIGLPGTFDDNGVVATSVRRHPDGRVFMYYAGFELCHHIRYRMLAGLAISEDDGDTFTRYSNAPILERSDKELHFRSGPDCLFEKDRVRMWYVGGSEWMELEGKSMPIYQIYHTESSDGIHWPSEGQIVLPITEEDEHGFGRPYVIPKLYGGYRLFYSVRRKSFAAYRMGYAESDDGIHWKRMDEKINLDVTPGSFDSHAIMYAAPVEVHGRFYLFYNGNEFGVDGIALAQLEMEW